MGMFSVASLLAFFWQTVVADVWCRWNSSCVLEASFPVGEDVEVQWRQMSAGKAHVHSFYDNADRLVLQDQRFWGRTSLFKEGLKEGKASLLLRNVIVGDSGTYQCNVATVNNISWSIFEVHVEAPVTAIQIRQVKDNQLLCSSEGIYPRPQIRWFFGPALAPAPDSTTNVLQQTETQLFSINSLLRLMGDGEYVCEVSASNSSRRTTWRKTGSPNVWDIVLGVLGALVSVALVVIIYYDVMVRCRSCRRERKTRQERTDEELAENVPLGEKATSLEVSFPESMENLGTGDDADNRTGRYQASNNGQSLPVGKKSSFASRIWWEKACQSITKCLPHSLFLNTRKL